MVLYVDEVDIHLNPKIGPDWMLRGTQKTVLTPGKNQKRYLAGALNARTGRLTWVEAERKNSQLFILQLWQLVGRDYPQAKRIHLILDNYRIHSSLQTKAALAQIGRPGRAALPAAVLPRSQSHRACVARPARQRHPQSPVSYHERTDDGSLPLAQEAGPTTATPVLPEESRLSLLESRKAI